MGSDATGGSAYERHLAEVTERNDAARKVSREKRAEIEREREIDRRHAEDVLEASMPSAGGQDRRS